MLITFNYNGVWSNSWRDFDFTPRVVKAVKFLEQTEKKKEAEKASEADKEAESEVVRYIG